MVVKQENSKVRETPLTGGGKVYPAFSYACRLLLPTAGFLNRDFDLLPLAFPGHLSGLRRKGLCLIQRKVQIEIVVLLYISTQYLRLLQTDKCARSEKHKGSGLEKHKGGGPWGKDPVPPLLFFAIMRFTRDGAHLKGVKQYRLRRAISGKNNVFGMKEYKPSDGDPINRPNGAFSLFVSRALLP